MYGKPSEAYTAFEQLIAKMTKAESIEWVDHEVDGQESFVEKGATFYVNTGKTIDVDQLIQDLEAELSYTEGFVKQGPRKTEQCTLCRQCSICRS